MNDLGMGPVQERRQGARQKVDSLWEFITDLRTLAAAVFVIVMVAILVPIRQNRLTNSAIRENTASIQTQTESVDGTVKDIQEILISNRATSAQSRDCILPTGVCYQETQRRTAALVQRVVDYVIVANICSSIEAREGGSVDQISARTRACIKERAPK